MQTSVRATTAYISRPLHPCKMQRMQTLYDSDGNVCTLLDIVGQCGKWQMQIVASVDGKNVYTMYTYDEHVYNCNGKGEDLPLLYLKNPRRG